MNVEGGPIAFKQPKLQVDAKHRVGGAVQWKPELWRECRHVFLRA